MRNFIFFLLFIPFGLYSFAQTEKNSGQNHRYKILLSGASFASPENTWFETGCKKLGAIAINRATGGEAIANTANKMAEGSLYSSGELDEIDAFVIMQVHNKDVFEESKLKNNYQDYKIPFDRSNYAAAFDYVIKRYYADCYELRNLPSSKYFGTKAGKPVVIVLCTDWHDARTIYNTSVRKLAEKWGIYLIEFDRNIGFSKNGVHPQTGQQISLHFSTDTQTIEGKTYGWHPIRGYDSFIQQKMASIFADMMQKILP